MARNRPDGAQSDGPVQAAIADLQMRLTYQDDEIHHLNQVLETQRVTLAQQAARIEALERVVTSLAQALREQVTDAPPPHY